MSRILAVSPHLDDAIFSAGGTLAGHALAGDEVTVLTCFTGNVESPGGFALACQLDKGLDAQTDYMALRRAEDAEACAVIGAQALHWPFLEAPHRGYDSAAALFAAPLPDDDIAGVLTPALVDLIADLAPDSIYGPWGVGNHVDHLAVRAALRQSARDVVWWEDYPYSMRETSPPAEINRRSLTAETARAKLDAALRYRSQLGFQFGGIEQARQALASWQHEGLARSDPPAR